MDRKNFKYQTPGQAQGQTAVTGTVAGAEHTQLGGMASYDEVGRFMFAPDDSVPGRNIRFRCRGTAQQMSDGTFDFVPSPQPRTRSLLIRKLAHGRVSRRLDGAIQLTLRVSPAEGVAIARTMALEAEMAAQAIMAYQEKR